MRAPLLAITALSALGLSLSACSEKASDNLENAGSAIGNDVSNAVDDAGGAFLHQPVVAGQIGFAFAAVDQQGMNAVLAAEIQFHRRRKYCPP